LLDQQVRMRIPDAHVTYIDPRDAAGLKQPVMDAVQQADEVIAAIYVVPSGGKPDNSMAVQDAMAGLLHEVLRTAADKTIFAAMGSPYLAAQFPEVQTYLCTYSNAQVSEISAVKAMFGEIPTPGRLPVTIPNIANRGAGLGGPAPVSTTPASPKAGLAGDPDPAEDQDEEDCIRSGGCGFRGAGADRVQHQR